MNSVSRTPCSAQRVFALIAILAAAATASPAARADRLPPPSPENAADVVDLWDQLIRAWIESLRQMVLRPLPPAGVSVQELMLGTVQCHEAGGFPVFAPNDAPQQYKDTIKALHELSLTAPDTISPTVAANFRSVMIAAGATR